MSTVESENIEKEVKFLKITNANFLPTVPIPKDQTTKSVHEDSISSQDLLDRIYENKPQNQDNDDKLHDKEFDTKLQDKELYTKLQDKEHDTKLQDKEHDTKLQESHGIQLNGRNSQTLVNQIDRRTRDAGSQTHVVNTSKQDVRGSKYDVIASYSGRSRHILSKPAVEFDETLITDKPQDDYIHKSSTQFHDSDYQDIQRRITRQSEKSNLSEKSFDSQSWVESECLTPCFSRMSSVSNQSNRTTSLMSSSASFYPETGYPETCHLLEANYPPIGYPSSGFPIQVYPPTTFPATGVYPGLNDEDSILYTQSLPPSRYGDDMTRSVSWNTYSRSGSQVSARFHGTSPYPQ